MKDELVLELGNISKFEFKLESTTCKNLDLNLSIRTKGSFAKTIIPELHSVPRIVALITVCVNMGTRLLTYLYWHLPTPFLQSSSHILMPVFEIYTVEELSQPTRHANKILASNF
jgi:hypothetical protein